MNFPWISRTVAVWTAAATLVLGGEKITHATPSKGSAPSPVSLRRHQMDGISVHVVQVDLRSKRVRLQPQLARRGVGSAESLRAMTRRTAPDVALTGTFFDTRTLRPVGDIVIGGRLVHFGGRGAALCVRQDRKRGLRVRMRPNAGKDRHTNWGRQDMVMAGGMWLVRKGKIALAPRKQGFRDAALLRPNARVAVGLTADGRLLLAATSARVPLRQWARMMHTLGATDALNFDGGSSTGLYYQGKAIVRPGRRLTNALVVFVEPPTRRLQVATTPRRGKPATDRT